MHRFALTALAAAALLLTGCASTAPGSSDAPPADLEVKAAWIDGGRLIALETWGSSTCVPVADDVTLSADGSVAVTLTTPGEVCTMDYVPRATLIAPPEGADAASGLDLIVTLDDVRGDASLDAFAGDAVAEYAPSAAWLDSETVAILTWGSSSCAPVVESAEATSPTEVSVVFVDPGMKPCTMDMAPRVVLVSVAGVDAGAAVVLSGGGAEFAEPVTVPIG